MSAKITTTTTPPTATLSSHEQQQLTPNSAAVNSTGNKGADGKKEGNSRENSPKPDNTDVSTNANNNNNNNVAGAAGSNSQQQQQQQPSLFMPPSSAAANPNASAFSAFNIVQPVANSAYYAAAPLHGGSAINSNYQSQGAFANTSASFLPSFSSSSGPAFLASTATPVSATTGSTTTTGSATHNAMTPAASGSGFYVNPPGFAAGGPPSPNFANNHNNHNSSNTNNANNNNFGLPPGSHIAFQAPGTAPSIAGIPQMGAGSSAHHSNNNNGNGHQTSGLSFAPFPGNPGVGSFHANFQNNFNNGNGNPGSGGVQQQQQQHVGMPCGPQHPMACPISPQHQQPHVGSGSAVHSAQTRMGPQLMPVPNPRNVLGQAVLFVGQLNYDVTELDVLRLFSFYGTVMNVVLLKDLSRSNKSKSKNANNNSSNHNHNNKEDITEEKKVVGSSAFVTYGSTDEADLAIISLHNKYCMDSRDKPLQVSYCQKTDVISDFGFHHAKMLHELNPANPIPAARPRPMEK